ncbi:MAG: hypothetical protein AAGI54_12825 [Planctomycetota bacterium]
MSEPGEANLWKSWVRWVSMAFASCIVLSIVVPMGIGIAVNLAGLQHVVDARLRVVLLAIAFPVFCVGFFGGIVFSSFVAPPVIAGHLRHQRWRDRPKKLHDSLAFAPLSPAVASGAVALLVPALVVGVNLYNGSDPLETFPVLDFLAWGIGITALLLAIGYPIHRMTQRRFRKTVAAARVCFMCGYNLQFATAAACPECGEPIPDTPATA